MSCQRPLLTNFSIVLTVEETRFRYQRAGIEGWVWSLKLSVQQWPTIWVVVYLVKSLKMTCLSQPSSKEASWARSWKDAPRVPSKRMTTLSVLPGGELWDTGLAWQCLYSSPFLLKRSSYPFGLQTWDHKDMGWSPCSATHQPYDCDTLQ